MSRIHHESSPATSCLGGYHHQLETLSCPVCFTGLLSALDSLSRRLFTRSDAQIARALDRFVARQEAPFVRQRF
jgi:hypothetical protein